jgi:hypothetical protein
VIEPIDERNEQIGKDLGQNEGYQNRFEQIEDSAENERGSKCGE